MGYAHVQLNPTWALTISSLRLGASHRHGFHFWLSASIASYMENQLTSGCLPIGANAGQELSKPLEK